MAEIITLLAFTLVLCFCIIANISVLTALFLGLICFIFYALHRNFSIWQIGHMIINGIKEAKTILIVFSLIGFLTALWRAGGTIPFIIYYTVPHINPRFFVMFAFLLCSLVSSLTGSAFATVSTMGVICMIIGKALGISPFYLGGSILSGVFLGDRCSPLSTSALLVCELTGTNIYNNIKNMIKTSVIPFLFTVAFYAISGYVGTDTFVSRESIKIFEQNFNLSSWVVLPALIIVVMTIFKADIKITILLSILAGIFVSIYFQGMNTFELLGCMLNGYHSANPELANLLDGGGLISMIQTMAIIAISSSYFGIFRNTKLLDKIKMWSTEAARHTTNFAAVLIVSIITAALSCNQTLATMLTYEITNKFVPNREELAIYLENSVIVVSALIPWSIAATFPLATVSAPRSSIIYAVYLYSIPLWNLLISYMSYGRSKKEKLNLEQAENFSKTRS